LAAEKQATGFKQARSHILVQITLLISVVVVLSGIGTFFLLRSSQQHIVNESIDRLIQLEADNFSSGYNYIAQLLFPVYIERLGGNELKDLVSSLQNKELSEMQKTLNSDLSQMIASGFLELQEVFLILPPSTFIPSAFVFAASDAGKVYNWEVPDYLVSALEDDETYIWMEDGIPELGLEGEYLITLGQIESPFNPGIFFAYVGIKPMHEEIVAINSLFDEEQKTANFLLAVVLGISIVVILLIIFILLNYLIHKRITEPIDELSAAAEEIMQGNLDVEIDVREGEEFAGLKYAFMQMVEGFRDYIAKSVGEDRDEKNTDIKSKPGRPARKRARILYEMTIILIVVMLVYGLATFLLIRNSQERLIEEGIDLLVQTEAENFISSLDYAIQVSVPAYMEAFEKTDMQELATSLVEERLTDMQRVVNADIREMIDIGFHGLEKVLIILPPSRFVPKSVVWASNDEGLIYTWEVPDYLVDALEEGSSYLLVDDGVPELGLEGECLITFSQMPDPLSLGITFSYVSFKPMHEEIAAIDDFYDGERTRANLYLAVIITGSILIVVLIAFFFLNHLIAKYITRPVDELSAAAEKVMQGDLDVQVDIREGEELESLKRAFNEMVDSLRKYIVGSAEDE
jgi:methyl-accepting chemotaxis protein